MALSIGELAGYLTLDDSKFETGLDKSESKFSKFGDKLKGKGKELGLAAGAALGAAVTAAVWKNIDAGKANDKLAAQLGLGAKKSEKIGRLAGQLYRDAYGESLEDVNEAVGSVMSSIEGMSHASGRRLQGVTEKAMNFASAFDVEVPRAVQIAGQAMRTGLAKNATQAFDLLTAASQKVPAAVREDLLDAVDEYGPFFQTLGYSGEQAFEMLVKGAQKGMYGIDKTGDAIKEFTIRSTDMSKTSKQAYKAIGLNAGDMADDILAGGDRAQKATRKIIDGLLSIESPSKRANAAIALFGTPLEDLNTSEIPGFLKQMRGMSHGLDDSGGAAKRMGDTLRDNFSTRMESWKRTAMGFAQDALMALVHGFEDGKSSGKGFMQKVSELGAFIKNDVVPPIADFVDGMRDGTGAGGEFADGLQELWQRAKDAFGYVKDDVIPAARRLYGFLMDNKDVLEAAAAGLVAAKLALIGYNAYVKASTAVTKAWNFAQKLLNGTMKANPIGLVITAIGLLVAGFVLAYKKSETFRKIVDAAWRGIKAAAKAVVGWFKDTAWPWMKKVFTQIGDIAQWTWKHVLKPSFDATKKAFGWVGDKFHTVWTKVLRPLFVRLTKGWMTVVSGILDGAAKAFGWVPGVGPKLKRAAEKFHDFKDKVNSALGKINDKHVDVSTKVMTKYGSGTVRWLRQNGGLAGGGTVHGPRAPYGDKVLQPLAPGEEVISNRSGQADRYRPILKAINANRYVPGLADGGTVRFGLGTSGLGSAAEKFGTIAADVNRANSSILSTLLRNMSGWFRAHPPMTGGPRATGGWRDLWRMVRSHFSGAILTSAYRPGATVAGFPGVLSRHGMGKAIDIAVNRKIWDWLVPQRNRFFELLGPWGMWRKGQPWHNPITAANHKDHIHISAYARGTTSARPGWAWVGERGPELVRFRGGERVLSNQQSQAQSSGPTFNTTINAPSDDAQAIWREFNYEFRRQTLAGVYS